MSDISIIASFQDVMDMALGSPELGAVNFNLLNAILQVMMKQMKLNDRYVQINGPDNDSIRMLMGSTHPKLPVKFAEFDPIHGLREIPTGISDAVPESNVIERNWKIAVLEPSSDQTTGTVCPPQVVVPVSEERFFNLESNIKDLKGKMAQILELPNDSNILEAMRSAGDRGADHDNTLSPVREMWHSLSLRKRVAATESGIDKLSDTLDAFMNDVIETLYSPSANILGDNSLVDDHRKKTVTIQHLQKTDSKDRNTRPSVFVNLVQRLDAIERTLELQPNDRRHPNENIPQSENSQNEDIIQLIQQVESLKQNVEYLEGVVKSWNHLQELEHVEEMFTDLENTKAIVASVAEQQESLTRTLNNRHQEFSNYKEEMQNHITLMQNQLDTALEHTNVSAKPAEAVHDLSVTTLSKKVINLEKALSEMSVLIQQLTEGVHERKLATDTLITKIEGIEHQKVNYEGGDATLSKIADIENITTGLNRKVSLDQFGTACEEMTKKIEDAANNFMEKEKIWSNTLQDIQAAVDSKINKIDQLEPLRRSLNNKMKNLNRRIKCVAESKKEPEAAATKSKLLMDVNCITCDKPVIMKKYNEHSLFPAPPRVPGKPSMQPYHSYQLDLVRKDRKCLNKDTSRIPKAVKEYATKNNSRAAHVSKRNYGGRHTVTTAKERVPRAGNFLDEWGPTIVTLKETYVQGTDGKVYKSRKPADASPPLESCNIEPQSVESSSRVIEEQPVGINSSNDKILNNSKSIDLKDLHALIHLKRSPKRKSRFSSVSPETTVFKSTNIRTDSKIGFVEPKSILKKLDGTNTLAAGDCSSSNKNTKKVRFSKSIVFASRRFGKRYG